MHLLKEILCSITLACFFFSFLFLHGHSPVANSGGGDAAVADNAKSSSHLGWNSRRY
jgi:hypothetical protein